MTADTVKRLRSEALTLTESERAELAYDLILSLDAPADIGVEEAWDREIIRRIAKIDFGEASLLSRDEFRKKLKDRIGNN